jgi:hypothetical protein
MRESMEKLAEQLAAVTQERDRFAHELSRHASIEEKAHLQTIDERDAAEEALSQAYFLVKGESPQWSNLFGHNEAIEEIDDAQKCWRAELAQLQARKRKLARAFSEHLEGDECILSPGPSLGPECCSFCRASAALADEENFA